MRGTARRSNASLVALIVVWLSIVARYTAADDGASASYSATFSLPRRSAATGQESATIWTTLGVTIDANLTNIVQSVDGGRFIGSTAFDRRGDITANVDAGKLGLWPGGFVTQEVEGNYDSSVNADTGALSPVNTNQLFPQPSGNNFNVPQLSTAQFASPYAGIVVGKNDTMSGDANEFAHGKGAAQFLNLAFNINPVALVGVLLTPNLR